MACLQLLGREMQREYSLFEFAADYVVDEDATGESVLARTCDVVRRHQHTLRRLKVPILRQGGVPALAAALAECTAITSLDLSGTMLPFLSWRQLGPTLRTLVLGPIDGNGKETTFRLLADNMPALRELHVHVLRQPSQDGFIELVSRLRSLSLTARGRPWDAVHDESAWPLTLPDLNELLWSTGKKVDAVAVAVLRRAVLLRAVDVSHASALAAIATGPPVVAVDRIVDPCMYYAPLVNLQTLTLYSVINDPLSLSKSLAASPRAATVQLRWDGTGCGQWDLLRAVVSLAAPQDEEAAGRCMRVRRVRLEVGFVLDQLPPAAAAVRCVRALFPRARYATWSTSGPPYTTLLSLLP
jgi:hypothetical protein